MRTAASLVVLAVFALGAITLASADGDAPDPKKMVDRIEALESQVEYLRAREDALTTYILANEQRASAIVDMGRKMRIEGWEHRKTTVPAKIVMLKGFDDLAASMRKDLPALSKEQLLLRKKADTLRKKATK